MEEKRGGLCFGYCDPSSSITEGRRENRKDEKRVESEV